MSPLTRAVLGILAGLPGGLVSTFLLLMSGVSHPCAYNIHGRPCTMNILGVIGGPLPTVPVGSIIVVAVLHVWQLFLAKQPRPWSVVGPAVVLIVVLEALAGLVDWDSEMTTIIPVPTAILTVSFALAGAVTAFSWEEILRYRGRRDRTEHRGEDR
ncbi:hypothetical protein [Lentzea sp. NPDC060358]|uniref:hypothetical protein n=1 Tax=Lentzea sp. NPDC060358 TaxID=3347103 RepID=UPI0036509153